MLERELRTPKGTHPLPSIPRPDPDGCFGGVLRIGTIPESSKNNHPKARTTASSVREARSGHANNDKHGSGHRAG